MSIKWAKDDPSESVGVVVGSLLKPKAFKGIGVDRRYSRIYCKCDAVGLMQIDVLVGAGGLCLQCSCSLVVIGAYCMFCIVTDNAKFTDACIGNL